MNLFVYGELCKPSVLRAVLGRVPVSAPALLRGHLRVLDRKSGYFRAAPHPQGVIVGLVLSALDAADFAALDAFENVAEGEYARCQVEVGMLIGGARQRAWMYA